MRLLPHRLLFIRATIETTIVINSMMEHLLLTLPIPEPKSLLQRIQIALPDLKITYLRHDVAPPEAFYKQDMYIPPGMYQRC